MGLYVQKFGGSSVGTLERIQNVASRVIKTKEQGHDVVVVVSAMQGETDRLIGLAKDLCPDYNLREYDTLVATGEQVCMALLAIALNARGYSARSYTGPQAGIKTDAVHSKARIIDVQPKLILRDLAKGHVVVVAGFQGVNEHGDVTTLGRGGSDTTAVALAAALQATECQIYTDVDGVYTSDPRVIPKARMLSTISFEEMLEMASLGAKVLQMRSVEFACTHNVPLRVLSSFNDGQGTLVTTEDKTMQRLVSGIAFSRDEAVISLLGVPSGPGIEGRILSALSDAHIEIDMIAQNTADKKTADFTFTVHRHDYKAAVAAVKGLAQELGAVIVNSNQTVAKLSLVGLGMRSHSGVAKKMFEALGNVGVNILMITTSEIKISVVIAEADLERGANAVHEAFELDKVSLDQPIQNFMET